MKVIIQKVKQAKVVVEEEIKGQIKHGYMLLVGIEETDTVEDLKRAALKITKLRLFDDEHGKINLSIQDVGGEILSISQFTLAADIRKGNRPSFIGAMEQNKAHQYYELFNQFLREENIHVETGVFQAHMNVILDNDGPVSIVMDVKDGKVL